MMTADFPRVVPGQIQAAYCSVGGGQLTAEFPAGEFDSPDKRDIRKSHGSFKKFQQVSYTHYTCQLGPLCVAHLIASAA